MKNYWFLNTDEVVWIRGLKDPVQEEAVTDATITGQMVDANNTDVGAEIAFHHVAGGDYYGTVPYDLSLVSGEVYTLVVSIQAAGLRLEIHIVGRAVYNSKLNLY